MEIAPLGVVTATDNSGFYGIPSEMSREMKTRKACPSDESDTFLPSSASRDRHFVLNTIIINFSSSSYIARKVLIFDAE